MLRTIANLIFVVMLSALTGCVSSGVSKDFTFSSGSPQGLLLVRTRTNSLVRSAKLSFLPYDDESGRGYGEAITLTHNNLGTAAVGILGGEGDEYHMVHLPPGSYVLEGTQSTVPNGKIIVCAHKGGIHFKIAPGKIAYVGDIDLRQKYAAFGADNVIQDVEAAKAALADYENIDAPMYVANLSDVEIRRREYVVPASDLFAKCRAKYAHRR